MPSKKESQSQADRFRVAARQLGTDESEEAFDRVLRKVGSAKPAPVHKAGTGKARKRKKASR